MSPPRAPRVSRFAEEAISAITRPMLRETVWLRSEDRSVLDEVEREHFRWSDAPVTDAVSAIEVTGGGWRARWVLAAQDGVHVARSVTLEPLGPTTPPGGVTTNLLRELSPQRALSTFVRDIPQPFLNMIGRETPTDNQPPQPEVQHQGKGGRPRVPDSELASVATAYLQELQSGNSGITTRVRRALGYEKDNVVRDRVRMCRERGWLSPTRQGRRGGEAGPALVQWWQERKASND